MSNERRLGWALALTSTLTMAVSYFDRQTLAVLAPTVTKALDISNASYGWLASAFSIAYLAGAPVAGRLIDLVGARRGLLGAVLVWSVVAGLHALAPGFGVLFGLRIALGLAEAPSFPGAAQTVHRALPPEKRARGYGILFTGSSIGGMLAPPLASWLEGRYGWRIAFLGTAVIGLSWVPVWALIAFSPRGRQTLDRAQAEAAPARPRGEWLHILANPAVVRAVIAVLASSPGLAFAFLWSAKFLAFTYHSTQAEIGKLLWFPPLVFDAGAVAFGHFASVRASRPDYDGSPPRALFAGALVLALALAAVPYASSPEMAVAIAAVAMGGGGALFALLTADMLGRVPATQVSSAGGITAAAQSLAYIVASPLIGLGVDHYQSYTPILWPLALFNVPGCVIWLLWRRLPPILHDR